MCALPFLVPSLKRLQPACGSWPLSWPQPRHQPPGSLTFALPSLPAPLASSWLPRGPQPSPAASACLAAAYIFAWLAHLSFSQALPGLGLLGTYHPFLPTK